MCPDLFSVLFAFLFLAGVFVLGLFDPHTRREAAWHKEIRRKPGGG